MQANESAMQTALQTLPAAEQYAAMVTLAALQTLAAQQSEPRQRFTRLLHDIATIAVGDVAPRTEVETALLEMERHGWLIRERVLRIWAGERDQTILVAGLDEQDTLLLNDVLALIAAHGRGEWRTPGQILAQLAAPLRDALTRQDEAAFRAALDTLNEAELAQAEALLAELQAEAPIAHAPPYTLSDAAEAPIADAASADSLEDLFASLPPPVRTAIEQGDPMALQQALAAFPPAEAQAIVARLIAAGVVGTEPEAAGVRHDMEQVLQAFTPLLGDIALTVFGNETARQLAENILPQLEQGGWRLHAAVERIWAGERDTTALTAQVDPNSAILIEHIIQLVASGPASITTAGALQIAHLRHQTDVTAAQALRDGDRAQRTLLAGQITALADQAEQQFGAPWQELAAHLRGLVVQLRAKNI